MPNAQAVPGVRLTRKQRAQDQGPDPGRGHQHKGQAGQHPDRELRDFVADDETKPKTACSTRATRRSIPQLVWKGKDEQDRRADLAVPAVPIYIQEKIHPQAIIENLRRTAAERRARSPS